MRGTFSYIQVSLTSVSSSCVLSSLIFADVTVKTKVTVRGSEKGWTKSPQTTQCLKLSQSSLWEWEESSLCRWVLWAAGHADIRDGEIMTLCQSVAHALVLPLLLFPLRELFVPWVQHDKHTCNENAWLYPHRAAPNYRRDPEVVMTVLRECKMVLSRRAPGEPLILPCLASVPLHILGSSCSHDGHVSRGHLDFYNALGRSVSPFSL